jgi:hypothetical protein
VLLSEKLVHACRISVLWGTHGYGFKTVEPFFPILKKPLSEFVETYSLTHCIVDERYVDPTVLNIPLRHIITFTHLSLYSIGIET